MVIVGKFGKPYGVKGLIKVVSFTHPFVNIIEYQDWHINRPKPWQKIDVVKIKLHANAIVAEIAGYNDRDAIASLTNAEIAVPRDSLPDLEKGEYYWDELVGLDVVDVSGMSLGQVVDIFSNGAHDVIVIGEQRLMLPYILNRYIKSVDLQQKRMVVCQE
jgi:16S rRNA processing protein RimM